MKKAFLIVATCAAILTSCNKNEITDNLDTSNGQLTFSPAIGKQTATKASELNNVGLQTANSEDKGIVLYAYQDNDGWKQWFNDKLWCENSIWKIASTRFRNTSKSKFISFYPKTAQLTVDNDFGTANFQGTFPKFVYNASTTLSEQVDLIAGITDVNANGTDVVFKMRHILSQVNFGVKGYNGAKISIKSITVKGVNAKGEYTFSANEATSGTDIIGKWAPSTPAEYTYEFPAYTVGETATSGDTYIFGDGGNWGPGKTSTTWYVKDATTAIPGSAVNDADKLSNSMMLIPQILTGATVEFTYTIQDKDGAYVAGSASAVATGTFKLDFVTGGTSGTHYLGKWEQNYRYLYIIDFTDFLDDNSLTFKVDVEAYPWENYNNGGSNDGVVDIPVLGQPTELTINGMATGGTYYMASRKATIGAENAQLVKDVKWDWTLYDFTKIKDNTGDKIIISFQNVIFNGKTIALTLPMGYTATADAGITLTNDVISAGLGTATATITITNTSHYNDAGRLQTAIEAVTATTSFAFTGNGSAIDLGGYAMNAATPAIITIKFMAEAPTAPPTTTNWSWDGVTKTATYTGQ